MQNSILFLNMHQNNKGKIQGYQQQEQQFTILKHVQPRSQYTFFVKYRILL